MPFDFSLFAGFIFMLGITMVAAPGVPGGAIMASLGILQSMLGFDESAQALMIALYIAMDSFGTACNVTGDGAIALIIDKIMGKRKTPESLLWLSGVHPVWLLIPLYNVIACPPITPATALATAIINFNIIFHPVFFIFFIPPFICNHYYIYNKLYQAVGSSTISPSPLPDPPLIAPPIALTFWNSTP